MEITPFPGTNGAANPFFSPDGHGWASQRTASSRRSTCKAAPSHGDRRRQHPRRGVGTRRHDRAYTEQQHRIVARVSRLADRLSPYTKPATASSVTAGRSSCPAARRCCSRSGTTPALKAAACRTTPRQRRAERRSCKEAASAESLRSTPSRVYLVYAQADGLLAAPFDLERLEIIGGDRRPWSMPWSTNLSGGAQFAFSQTGCSRICPEACQEANKTLLWVDRTGKETAIQRSPTCGAHLRGDPRRQPCRAAEHARTRAVTSGWKTSMTR